MSQPSIKVTVDAKLGALFAGVGAILGFLASVLIGPVVAWLLDHVDAAPGQLRLIDQLPLVWSMPLLTLAGAVAGWFIYVTWGEEVGFVVVDAERVLVKSKESSAVFARAEIAEVFLDKDELVLLDHSTRELSRSLSESSLAKKLSTAFLEFEYPWMGAEDPRDVEFGDWVDRSPQLEEPLHSLLRARSRALEDGKRGEASSLREQLSAGGIVIRGRHQMQQIRVVARP